MGGGELATLRYDAAFLNPSQPWRAAAFSPDGRKALITSQDGPVPVWNLHDPRAERYLSPGAQLQTQVGSVAWSPDGTLAALADREHGTAYVFDPHNGRLIAQLRGHRDEIRSVAFSPDSRWLVTASADKTARVWQASDGQSVMALYGHRAALVDASFAHDGHHVLTASEDGTARVYDCSVCAPLGKLLADVPNHVSFGRHLTPAERSTYVHESS